MNASFLAGVGLKRQREMFNQYALNDRRLLPSIGLPAGNIAGARITWEARDQQPDFGSTYTIKPKSAGAQWVEVVSPGQTAAACSARPRSTPNN